MVDNQHKKITGYRDLTEEEITLMNEVKTLAEKVHELTTRVMNTPGIDQRWNAIGVTDLQKGFMAVTRAIARPTTF